MKVFGIKAYRFVTKQVFEDGDGPKWENWNFSEKCGAKNKRNTLSRPVGARDNIPVRKRGDKNRPPSCQNTLRKNFFNKIFNIVGGIKIVVYLQAYWVIGESVSGSKKYAMQRVVLQWFCKLINNVAVYKCLRENGRKNSENFQNESDEVKEKSI